MDNIKILLAEDDENLGFLLKESLISKGFETELFTDGEAAYNGFVEGDFNFCLFDVMMPKKDGFTLAKEIRDLGSNVPVIFLTAKNMKDDVLDGFKAGGDDYMTKPFVLEELIFRIEAILKRTNKETEEVKDGEFKIGTLMFDSLKQILIDSDGESTKLTTKESELLKLLCINSNKVLERNYALKSIWVDDNYFNARSMDVYITKLRKHLKKDPTVEILNVHGKGYKLIV